MWTCNIAGYHAHSAYETCNTMPCKECRAYQASLAHGAFVTVICAAVEPESDALPGGGLIPNVPLLGPGGFALVYGIPEPEAGGILVAWAHGAAVPAPDGGGGIGACADPAAAMG